MRPSGRKLDEMRSIQIETNVTKHAEGSCLIKVGDTHVLCTATVEDRVPPFIKGSGWDGLPRNTACCPVQHHRVCAAKLHQANKADALWKFNA